MACLPLDVLPRAESVALLRGLRPDLSAADADAIAAEVGDLPLALHVAGRFLATYRHAPFGAPAAYLAQLQEAGLEHPSLSEERETFTTGHTRHVNRTFALSYERLDPAEPVDALARDLLARAAYFAPGEPIPRALLLATVDLPEEDFAAQRRAADALARLVALGLLETEDGGDLLLHRLLVAFVLRLSVDEEARFAVENTLLTEARRVNFSGYLAPLLAWQFHLRHVTDMARMREDKQALGLCANFGYHLKIVGAYTEAQPYFERALIIQEQRRGPHHPDTALSLDNLGSLLRAAGDLTGAQACYERALEIQVQTLDTDHLDTAQTLNNLGLLLRTMGKLSEAQTYLEQALAIRAKLLGNEHRHTAGSFNALGMVMQARGELAAAQHYYKQALTIDENILGPLHPYTASCLNNLGSLRYEMGDLTEARVYLEQALHIREQVLGLDHPDTAQSLHNLGTLCYAEGHLEEAARLMRRALWIQEAVLGRDHPDTQNAQHNLSKLEAAIEERAGK